MRIPFVPYDLQNVILSVILIFVILMGMVMIPQWFLNLHFPN